MVNGDGWILRNWCVFVYYLFVDKNGFLNLEFIFFVFICMYLGIFNYVFFLVIIILE